MKVLLFPLLFALVAGQYNFNYATGDAGGHERSESGNGASVSGKYSYVDPNGNLRVVSYTAGPDGFHPSGDIGVDKKTAEDAAKIAALAPKAPVDPNHAALAAGAPWYGNWWGQHGAPWYGNWWGQHGAPWYGHWGHGANAWGYNYNTAPHWGRWW